MPVPLPPRAPKRSRAWKITGIVAVVFIGLIWLTDVVHNYLGDAPFDGDTSGPAYRLTVPRTLADGKYTLSENLSNDLGSHLSQDFRSNPQTSKLTAAGAQYRTGSGSSTDVITYSGYYGPIPYPAVFRAGLLRWQGPGEHVAVGPRALVPAGSRRTVNCEVLTSPDSDGGRPMTIPVCAWNDSSTAILVYRTTHQIAGEAPSAVDLQALADLTGTVIDEVRTPVP